jgi:predicted Zn finger-like uncharacterized protein
MPILVTCPACSQQLRVTDALVGKKVRCSACKEIFEAIASPDSALPPDSASNLPLEQSQPTGPSDAPGPSIKLSLDDDETPASSAPPPKPPLRSVPRELPGSLDADDRDPRDYDRRERRRNDSDEEDRERRRRRYHDDDFDVRRRPFHGEPHRGGTVLALGITSLVLTVVCGCLGCVGVVPGAIAWAMGNTDLRKIKQGLMDPEGEGTTRAGFICGIVGTCLSIFWLLIGLAYFAIIAVAISADAAHHRH